MSELVYHRIGLQVTYRCSLKCRLCLTFTPYHTAPVPHYSSEYLNDETDRLFRLIDRADIFSLCGGEPFLHKELNEVIDHLVDYRDRIGVIHLVTNGTIVPDEKLIKSIVAANVHVILDDYGEALSPKDDEIEALFIKYGVDYERRYNGDTEKGAHFNGWVDVMPLDTPKTEEEAKQLFDKCISAHELRCHPVIDGKVYLCSVQEMLIRLGRIKDDPKYSLDLFDDTASIEEQKRRAADFLDIDYLPSCRYCKGFCKDSERFVPAEQMTGEELKATKENLKNGKI